MSLGNHLRADEDVDLFSGKARQQCGNRAPAADRVAIDAANSRLRQQRFDFRFHSLGAEAELLEIGSGAFAAHFRQRPGEVAVVAPRASRSLVHRQRDAAVRTFHRLAALAAEHDRREAAPVEQHDGLLPLFDPVRQGVA